MSVPAQIIDVNTDYGKKFISDLEKLKKTLKIDDKGEKARQHKELTPEQIKENSFLLDFMKNEKTIFKDFEIKRVYIGNFGRKSGYIYLPIKENYFRFFIHFGSNEAYYLNDDTVKDKIIPLAEGEGFIVASFSAPSSSVIVYQDPIRMFNDIKIREKIPKIRPRNYNRTTLIYDLYYDIPYDEIDQELKDNQFV